jgi:hypothetical protein
MSTTSEPNPVDAIVDILEATDDTDYANDDGKPNRIARSDDYTQKQKRAYYQTDALYVRGDPAGGAEQTAHDATGEKYQERATVLIEVWSPESDQRATSIGRDVHAAVRAYWTDNAVETVWTTIRPSTVNDWTDESFNTGKHSLYGVVVDMMRLGDV